MKKVFVAAAVALSIVACSRDKETSNPVDNSVSDFDKLKVNNSFNWATTQPLTLNLIKVPGAQSGLNMLTVKDVNGNLLYKARVSMAVDGTETFDVPKALTQVEVEYGITKKLVSISGAQANFDFLPVLDNSDLD